MPTTDWLWYQYNTESNVLVYFGTAGVDDQQEIKKVDLTMKNSVMKHAEFLHGIVEASSLLCILLPPF